MSDPTRPARPPKTQRLRSARGPWFTRMVWVGGGVVALLALMLGLYRVDEAKFERELAHAEAVLLGEQPGDTDLAAWTLQSLVSREMVRCGGTRSPHRAARLRETAVPALRAGLRSPRVSTRRASLEASRWLGVGSFPAVSELEPLLVDEDEDMIETAAEMLGEMGPPAEGALLRGLKAERAHTRASSVHGLSLLGPEVIGKHQAPLIALLRDGDPRVREGAVGALGFAKECARAALPALAPLLLDTDQSVRLHTVDAVDEIGASREVVPHLARTATTDGARDVRAGAASALGSLRPEDASAAIPVLVACLADPAATVRARAAGALGRLGPAAAAALPDLRRALDDRDASVRAEATAAIGRMGR